MLPEQTEKHSPEVLAAIRRANLLGKALSVVMDLQPGEGLADVIFRAACENGYTNPRDILAMMRPRTQKTMSHGSFTKDDGFDPDRIADVLGTPRGGIDIVPLMYPRKTSTTVSFFGVELRKEHLRSAYRRVAPRSLGARPYMKAAWALRAFTFDLDTGEMLLDHCPLCETKLSFATARGVAGCGACIHPQNGNRSSVDLRDFPQPLVEVEHEEGLRFLGGLVNPDKAAREFTSSRLAGELKSFSRGEILDFSILLGRALLPNFVAGPVGRADRWSPLPPGLLAEVGDALMRWPRGFQELSDRLRLANGFRSSWSLENISRSDSPNVGKSLKHLARKTAEEGFREATYERVSAALKADTCEDRHLGASRTDSDGWVQSSRVELSRLSQGEVDGLPLSVKLALLIRTSSLLLRLAKTTGVPTPFLPDLLLGGLSPCLDGNLKQFFNAPKKKSNTALSDKLKSVSQSGTLPCNALPLVDVLSSLTTSRTNPWAAVLSAIIDRKLAAWMVPSDKPLVHQIWVADFQLVRNLLKLAPPRSDLGGVRVSGAEAATILARATTTIIQLRASGAMRRDSRLDTVWDHHEKYVLTKEIRVRSRMAGRSLRNNDVAWELDTAGIEGVRSPLVCAYDRKSVETYYGSRIMRRADIW